MANDFSGDPSCKALWRFENGALVTDSIGTNTLTAYGTPTADVANYKEGAAAVAYGGSAYHYITDDNLSSGFPFKNGDTTKLATICCWFNVASVASGEKTLYSKFNTGAGRYYPLTLEIASANLQFLYGRGTYDATWVGLGTVSAGVWYHLSVVIDGVNGRVWAVVYNDTTGVTTFFNAAFLLGTLGIGSDQWSIGERGDNEGYKFYGTIDEVVVFNTLKPVGDLIAIRRQVYNYPPPLYPANVFTGDNRFKAWWKFDTAAGILDDAIGSNTLVKADGSFTPLLDPVFFILGSGSCYLNALGGSNLQITDANLPDGFPLKNGDTTKQITVCCWIPPSFHNNANYDEVIWSKRGSNSSDANLSLGIGQNDVSPANQLIVKWNNEIFSTGVGLTINSFWHVTVVADGVNKTLKVRIYDTLSDTVTNYTFTPSAVIALNTDPWFLFCDKQDEGSNCETLDEVIVAAGLLSDNEIDAIRNGTFWSSPDPCRSLTTCEDIPAPPADCRSLTTCTSIGSEPPADCRSLTTCSELGLNSPASIRSVTSVQDVPLSNGGLFLVF